MSMLYVDSMLYDWKLHRLSVLHCTLILLALASLTISVKMPEPLTVRAVRTSST